MTSKPKPIKREALLEAALYQAYSDYEELQGLIYTLRETLKADCPQYIAINALNGIFSLAIHNQSGMMDAAGLEY